MVSSRVWHQAALLAGVKSITKGGTRQLASCGVSCRRLGSLAGSEGARPSSGLRSALQQQCRAWLDALHSRSKAHLNGALRLLHCRASRRPLVLWCWSTVEDHAVFMPACRTLHGT